MKLMAKRRRTLDRLLGSEFRKKFKRMHPEFERLLFGPASRTAMESARKIKKRFEAFKYWVVRDKRKAIDEMFFKYENLPPFTKEYWFMHLDSVEPGLSRQLVFMFMKYSSKAKSNRGIRLDKKPGIACWFFDGKKYDVAEVRHDVKIEKNRIHSPIFRFEGSYPNYSLKIYKGKKKIGDLKFHEAKKKRKYDFDNVFVGPLGFELVNLYLDFKGMLNSKKISGVSLVQKVIVTTPFLPWRWGWVHFRDGSVVEYFLPQLDFLGVKYRIKPTLRFTDRRGKRFDFENFEIKKAGDRWFLHTRGGELSLLMKSYASSRFIIQSIGKFHYDEYFTKVIDFSFKRGGKEISMEQVRHGSGLVEDAYGFTL